MQALNRFLSPDDIYVNYADAYVASSSMCAYIGTSGFGMILYNYLFSHYYRSLVHGDKLEHNNNDPGRQTE